MIGLNKIGLNQVQLNRLYLNAPFPVYRKMAGGGSSGDGFPVLPGDVTRWHFGGLTNEMMAAMDDPRIEDADHKGRFLSFKNFAWGGMSGVGGYKFNFKNSSEWNISVVQVKEHNDNRIVINNRLNAVQLSYKGTSIKIVIKLTGVEENNSRLKIYDDIDSSKEQSYNKDGIYEIDYIANDGANYVYFYITGGNYGELDLPITIEQLPLYPGALVFDGADDCGTCDNFPILTKEKGYTVVALRSYLAESIGYLAYNGTSAKQSAFAFERSDSLDTWSWGENSSIRNLLPKLMSYQTSNSYNNNIISTGTAIEGDKLIRIASVGGYCNVAIWELVFLDHDATEEELTKIKNYFVKTYPWLFPDQAWTVVGKTNEDTDRATIANITGNGNNLVLNNFGFAENSGYGLYAYNFNSFTLKDNEVKTTDVKNDSFRIVGTGNGSNVSVLSNTSNSANWKIRVTGMKEGDNLIVGNANKSGDYFTITKDGIYTFQKQYEASSTNGVWYNSAQETDVLVEQIPEYEGYLVTDGVDDGMTSSNFPMGKDFTVVGEWRLISVSSYNYAGILKSNNLYVYNNASTGLNIYVCSSTTSNYIHGVKSLKAIRSDGRVYDENWTEYKLEKVGYNIGANSTLDIGTNKNNFTKIAFKNLEIYNNKILSKEDCIKAYNYLQTLKAKI